MTPSRPISVSAPSARPKIMAKGLYPFSAQNPSELSFQFGDVLTVLKQDGDWWTAELNGRTGLIPGNYVQLL